MIIAQYFTRRLIYRWWLYHFFCARPSLHINWSLFNNWEISMVVVMVRIQMMALLCSALWEAAAAVSYEEEHIGILELKNAFFCECVLIIVVSRLFVRVLSTVTTHISNYLLLNKKSLLFRNNWTNVTCCSEKKWTMYIFWTIFHSMCKQHNNSVRKFWR